MAVDRSIVLKIRINVPFRLAVARRVPDRFNAIQARSDWWADTEVGEMETDAVGVSVESVESAREALLVGGTTEVVDRSSSWTLPIRGPG